MMALLFLGALLIIVAWHLARSFLADHLTGFAPASPWRLFWAAGSGLTGLGLLTVPLAMIDDIAARMGVGVVVLVLLLLSEARLGRGRRRRR